MWRFLGGKTHYWPGLPAKDMTDDEWRSYDRADRDAARYAGLYKKDSPSKTEKPDDTESETTDSEVIENGGDRS